MNTTERVLVYGATGHTGRFGGPGALAPGQAFDAADVLTSLHQRVSDLVLRRDELRPVPRGG